ncbi:MAG TPA: DNA-3-methyladenine glycosylase 2 family protein [Pyrinomonadaceae bacterium]|jgi:DNA-3-methyladenine glycosylase II|nr:DNA-3-methyladenine glycosylase 2 family protein [Pyrinomonadaceae bacterium]
MPPKSLDEASLARGVRALAKSDEDLARVVRVCGAPPMWEREPGFPALVLTILEQKISLDSARAVFGRLLALAPRLTPRALLALDDSALTGVGFSRRKALYCQLAARAIVEGHIDLDALELLDDDAVRAALVALKGVGPWTAEIYLLRCLERPDAWPSGDLALQIAAQQVKRLDARPTPAELDALAEPWRPWRAVAARILWSHYLNRAGRNAPP